jgi:hypothetical protein
MLNKGRERGICLNVQVGDVKEGTLMRGVHCLHIQYFVKYGAEPIGRA